MDKVKAEEVRDILNKIGKGELRPTLAKPLESWDAIWCGNVEFLVNGWKIVIFNDCGEWDYVDAAVAPDGRVGIFEDWFNDNDEPEYKMDDEVFKSMIIAFKNAVYDKDDRKCYPSSPYGIDSAYRDGLD